MSSRGMTPPKSFPATLKCGLGHLLALIHTRSWTCLCSYFSIHPARILDWYLTSFFFVSISDILPRNSIRAPPRRLKKIITHPCLLTSTYKKNQ